MNKIHKISNLKRIVNTVGFSGFYFQGCMAGSMKFLRWSFEAHKNESQDTMGNSILLQFFKLILLKHD